MDNATLTRYFLQKSPPQDDNTNPKPETLNIFFQHHIFVVLGEPGLGKSTCFKNAANDEPNSTFIRIGEFLSASSLEIYKDKTLYLDGLDEHRSQSEKIDVMDALICRIKELEYPKVRISCRTAEWHAGKDIYSLSDINDDQEVVVLQLLPLERTDAVTLADNSEEFIRGAIDNGLDTFLSNPQDLILLYAFYKDENKWPENRLDLMFGTCEILLKEENPIHAELSDENFTDRDLKKTSDYLATILMLSNVEGIASHRKESSKQYPSIHQFDGNITAMKAAMKRRVFKPTDTHKIITPAHRKIAEFMTARHLTESIREGLPLRRVMALLTGLDGSIPSDLRGVYGWLVTLLSGDASTIIKRDPYGAMLYGDTSAWTPYTKKIAFEALQELSQKEPYFRHQDWSKKFLSGLSDPSLVEYFKTILETDNGKTHLVMTVLDSISVGKPLPKMEEALLAFIKNPAKSDHIKDNAVDAYVNSCPNSKIKLISILNDIEADRIKDNDDYLKGAILYNLYPNTITPYEILNFIKESKSHVIGRYHLFLSHGLIKKSSFGDLKIIAEQFSDANKRLLSSDYYPISGLISSLIETLVTHNDNETSIENILEWLKLGVNEFGTSNIEQESQHRIRTYLASQENLYYSLLIKFIGQINTSGNTEPHEIWWRFTELTLRITPPASLSENIKRHLNSINLNIDPKIIYWILCKTVFHGHEHKSPEEMDYLISLTKENINFQSIYEHHSSCEVNEWRIKQAKENKTRSDEKIELKRKNIGHLQKNIEEIRAGKKENELIFCSVIWHGRNYDSNDSESPENRLKESIGGNLLEPIKDGFENSILEIKLNSFDQIASESANGSYFKQGYLVLSSVEVIYERQKESLLNLPINTIKIAIAYYMAAINYSWNGWIEYLFKQIPDTVTSAISSFWEIEISKDSKHLAKYYELNKETSTKAITNNIIINVLFKNPKINTQILEQLLKSILENNSNKTEELISNALSKRYTSEPEKRTIWLSAGFSIDVDKYFNKLTSHLKKHPETKDKILSLIYINPINSDENNILDKKKYLILLLGSIFDNVSFLSGATVTRSHDPSLVANDIRSQIRSLSNFSSEYSESIIKDLLGNKLLSQWQDEIKHAQIVQLRNMKEAKFTYPTSSKVVSTLANKEPANTSDLKALTVDVIKEISDEIRHGNTDGYKAFWNIEKHSKASTVHIDENTSRDRLLDLLRPKIKHLDVIAEPEVSYADDKRADIAVYFRNMKLPIEIKRDDHAEIWTAPEKQLERLYTRDPASEGNGIYLVFWFDGKMKSKLPKGILKPKSAKELESSLQLVLPESASGLIDVIVIDVSVPEEKKAVKKKAVKKKAVKKKAVKKKAVKKKAVKKKAVKKKVINKP